jgi:predicted RNA-binding Zn-ribbon protein involved in translation (DUF1610 family)
MSEGAYERAWAAFRRAVRFLRVADELFLIPIALFGACIVGFELVPNSLDWRGPLWFSFLALLALTLGLRLLARRRVARFKCPRCSEPFVRPPASVSALERRPPCQHCGLPLEAKAP